MNHPIVRLSAETSCFIDADRDDLITEFRGIGEDGKAQAPEEIDLAQPILIGALRLVASALENNETRLRLKSTDTEAGTAPGLTAPDFRAPDLAGKSHALSASPGRPLLLEFWPVSCPWSEAVRPGIDRLIEKHPGLLLMSLAKEKDPQEVTAFMEQYIFRSRVLLRDDQAWHQYNPRGFIPMFYLIDKNGRVSFKGRGASMLEVIEALASESSTE